MGWEAVPDLLLLVGIDAPLLPVVHKHMQHDVFRHPLGEVIVVHPHDGNAGGKGGVLQDGINPGPQGKDHLQVGQALQDIGRRQPGGGILNILRIAQAIRPDPHLKLGRHLVHRGLPEVTGPCGRHEKKCHYCFTLFPGTTRRLSDAAISALV